MKFKISYKKKEEFEIKELNLDVEFSEDKAPAHPAIQIIRIMAGVVILIILTASALAAYGAANGHSELAHLAGRILEVNHDVIYMVRDLIIHIQEKI